MDCNLQGYDGTVKVITRAALYDVLQTCCFKKMDKKWGYLENYAFEVTKCKINILKRKLSHFKSEFKSRWTAAHKNERFFKRKNENWLQGTITFPVTNSSGRSGQPEKEFLESSDCTKRRKTKDIREHVPLEQLTYATQMSLRAAGDVEAAKILKEINNLPRRATGYRKSFSRGKTQTQLSPRQALSVFVAADLTRRQYNIIRSADKRRFPCYSILQKAKETCYPKREACKVTSTSAEVNLQDLLDHTSSRLCEYLAEVLEQTTEDEKHNLELISKWGCDGSQQSQFKQKFENDTDSDANIFQSSFVPIQLVSNINGVKRVLWQNPLPSSPRFCRPIRIRFIHETTDVTREEIQFVETQINNLKKSVSPFTNDRNLHVQHTLLLTMIDGKVCNTATNTTSTMRCYLCGCTSKDFNNLEKKNEVKPETVKFGLSVLHARIRFFELLLHLSYKLSIKKWQIRSENDKKAVSEMKKKIQDSFKQELGLRVDIPKAGFGNSNDGNTARKFFF